MAFNLWVGVVAALVLSVQACQSVGTPSCNDVDEPKEPQVLNVRVENRTSRTLYLKGRYGCVDPEAMQLKDASGSPVSTRRSCGSDEQVNSCELGPIYELVSGASHTISVEAAMYREPQCTLENGSGSKACSSRVALPSGNYSYSVSWYWGSDDGSVCGANGTECPLSVPIDDARHVATLEFAYPVSNELVLPIE